jgi:hypothetical protein
VRPKSRASELMLRREAVTKLIFFSSASILKYDFMVAIKAKVSVSLKDGAETRRSSKPGTCAKAADFYIDGF